MKIAKRKDKTKIADIVFFSLMMLIPLVQIGIFYFGVNINSVLLSFKEYSVDTGEYKYIGFTNYSNVIRDIFKPSSILGKSIKNSLIASLFTTIVGMFLGLFFSYAIFKKCVGHKFYKKILFMPAIIPSIALVMMFNYFVEGALPEVLSKLFHTEVQGLLSNPKTTFATLVFYTIWTSFGTSMLMYVGAMSSIDKSIIEAGQLDGATPFIEFFHLIFPSIFSTFSVLLITNILGIFTNQLNMYGFFGGDAEFRLYTFGYYLYRQTKLSSISEYPYLAALGILTTLVVLPVTLIIKKILDKVDPMKE